ncbi:DNA topoisomerase IB [Alkalihalobacillus hemicentroti]|uniref:DNA topoisomerase IB n=1 Tax=Guptibacillus hwajinpoensis TaxID=208199 RepID=A0ABU0JYS8_9BACL|nr:DNA topoisomerase IB [Alkalihalobacillus hemicentroti]
MIIRSIQSNLPYLEFLVFAPDRTVLESLKEIQTLDKRKVVPPEYVNLLDRHLKIHFLESTGKTLDTIDNSRFNLSFQIHKKLSKKGNIKKKVKLINFMKAQTLSLSRKVFMMKLIKSCMILTHCKMMKIFL